MKLESLLLDENKNFGGFLILNFRISWRHVQAEKKDYQNLKRALILVGQVLTLPVLVHIEFQIGSYTFRNTFLSR